MKHRLFVIGLLVLSGCSLAPEYQRPQMPIPAALGEAGNTPTVGPDDIVLTCDIPWQQFFSDDKLRSLIELTLDNNRDLRAAALQVERAQAAFRIERAELTPHLGVNAGGEKHRLPADLSVVGQAQTVEQYTVNLGVTGWELDFFGRLRNLKASALEQYLASKAARDATQVSLISGVASAYLALAADSEALALANATLQAQRASYDLIKQTCELGMGSDLELHQARSQVEAARVDRARLVGLVAVDRNALRELVGTGIPEDLLPETLSAVAERTALDGDLSSEVLLSRPDIVAAEHQLKAAYANIGAARAAYFPRISLTAAGGTLSSQLSGLFTNGSGTWSFAPQISVPIFTGGAIRAGVDVARAERELAVAAYEKAIQAAFREVNDALTLEDTLDEERSAQAALVQSLADTYELAQARWEAGLDSYLNVLVAERSLYAARQGLVSLRLADEVNQITLFKALGGGAGLAGTDPGGQGNNHAQTDLDDSHKTD